jgi:hypothetical protein
VIFVVLLVFSSDGGSFGDVGGMFFVMTSNLGMTSKLKSYKLLSEPMMELKVVFGKINNNDYNNAYIIKRSITCFFQWYFLWIDMEFNCWKKAN